MDMMADVKQMMGAEGDGDPLVKLDEILSAIEKYAVRLIEEVRRIPLLRKSLVHVRMCTRLLSLFVCCS